jgi:two-component system NarL family response regulator
VTLNGSGIPTAPEDASADDSLYRAILTSIVKRFVRLVGGSAALNVARKLPRLSLDDEGNVLDYEREDPINSITLLVEGYRVVFGEVAITLSREAIQWLAPRDERLWQDIWQRGLAPAPIQLLLVDDHALFREGLVSLLSDRPDMQVVGQAGTVREAIALVRELKPSVVLMDVTLPDGTGLDATRAILAEQPATKIVFLTVHDDDERLFTAIRAGAVGFLSKGIRAAELLERIRGVARGEAGISPAIARRILDEFSRTPEPSPAGTAQTTNLTARETEIVRELARGATNREIARKFVISENTVKNHVRNVLSKLHLRRRREIADYARDHGLSPPPDSG